MLCDVGGLIYVQWCFGGGGGGRGGMGYWIIRIVGGDLRGA